MKKTLLSGLCALAFAGSAFANELVSEPMQAQESYSYERSDPAFSYSELKDLERFDAIDESSSSEQLSESDVIWVFPVDTIVLVPSVDTEIPSGG